MGELKDLDDFYPPLDLSIFFSFLLSSSFLFLLHPQKQPQNLINEPRCRGCGTAIGDWAAAVAPSIKKEWRQLVTIGAEGFYSDSDPRASANPGGRGSWAGNEGLCRWIWHQRPVRILHAWHGSHPGRRYAHRGRHGKCEAPHCQHNKRRGTDTGGLGNGRPCRRCWDKRKFQHLPEWRGGDA